MVCVSLVSGLGKELVLKHLLGLGVFSTFVQQCLPQNMKS